jgi:hypothetical protein
LRSSSSSALNVPNIRFSADGSPSAVPIKTQTVMNFLPTSIPAQRSTIACMCSPVCRRATDVSITTFFHGPCGATLGFLYVGQVSFRYGFPNQKSDSSPQQL